MNIEILKEWEDGFLVHAVALDGVSWRVWSGPWPREDAEKLVDRLSGIYPGRQFASVQRWRQIARGKRADGKIGNWDQFRYAPMPEIMPRPLPAGKTAA